MPDSYVLISDPIPRSFQINSFVWDPKDPFIYLPSKFEHPDNTYLYKYDRLEQRLVLTARTANEWSAYGRPSVNLSGRLYWTPPGGLTYTTQFHGAFRTDDLTFIRRGEKMNAAMTACTQVSGVSGTYIADIHSGNKLWWHVTGSDLSKGTVTCFKQDEYCRITDPESLAPLWQYTIPQSEFGSFGGFTSDTNVYKDGTPDGAGNFWVYQAGFDLADVRHHALWRVKPNGVVEFIVELDAVMPSPASTTIGFLRWFQDDNSLIVCNGVGWVKYQIDTNTVTATLQGTGSNGLTIASNNYASFHHPDQRVKSIWIADYVLNINMPVPPGKLKYFPIFSELRMTDLQPGRQLVSYAFAQEYPTIGGAFAYGENASLDPETGGLWAQITPFDDHVAVFFFEDLPPTEDPGGGGPGGGVGGGINRVCLPKNTEFNVTVQNSQLSNPTLAQLNPTTVNFKKL